MIEQHLLNQVVDIPQDPAVVIFRKMFKQFGDGLVVYVKALSTRVGRDEDLEDELLRHIGGVGERCGVRRLVGIGVVVILIAILMIVIVIIVTITITKTTLLSLLVVSLPPIIELLQLVLRPLVPLLNHLHDMRHGILPGVVVDVRSLDYATLDMRLDHL